MAKGVRQKQLSVFVEAELKKRWDQAILRRNVLLKQEKSKKEIIEEMLLDFIKKVNDIRNIDVLLAKL